jgi:histidyl-tRNA synthetase
MKVPTKEELIHLKIQAAMRENAFIDSELKYLGEKEGHHWYLVAGEHEVSANQIELRNLNKRKMTEETVVIYSNESQECDRMKSLLKTLGGEFHEYILGKHFTEHQFRSEFGLVV